MYKLEKCKNLQLTFDLQKLDGKVFIFWIKNLYEVNLQLMLMFLRFNLEGITNVKSLILHMSLNIE